MSGLLGRRAVERVLAERNVGAHVPGGVDGVAGTAYRQALTDALLALRCTSDCERHHNEGFGIALGRVADLFADARSDLAAEAGAGDLLAWLEDGLKAIGGTA